MVKLDNPISSTCRSSSNWCFKTSNLQLFLSSSQSGHTLFDYLPWRTVCQSV